MAHGEMVHMGEGAYGRMYGGVVHRRMMCMGGRCAWGEYAQEGKMHMGGLCA